MTCCLTNNLNYALVSLKLLCKKVVKQNPPIKPCILLGVIYFWFTTGKSGWVHSHTHGLFPLVADDVLYNGYYKYCLHPAGDED